MIQTIEDERTNMDLSAFVDAIQQIHVQEIDVGSRAIASQVIEIQLFFNRPMQNASILMKSNKHDSESWMSNGLPFLTEKHDTQSGRMGHNKTIVSAHQRFEKLRQIHDVTLIVHQAIQSVHSQHEKHFQCAEASRQWYTVVAIIG